MQCTAQRRYAVYIFRIVFKFTFIEFFDSYFNIRSLAPIVAGGRVARVFFLVPYCLKNTLFEYTILMRAYLQSYYISIKYFSQAVTPRLARGDFANNPHIPPPRRTDQDEHNVNVKGPPKVIQYELSP